MLRAYLYSSLKVYSDSQDLKISNVKYSKQDLASTFFESIRAHKILLQAKIVRDRLPAVRFSFFIRLRRHYNMNKCEHGEKIAVFCASECCVWKEAAGCDHCMKKYHNHMGPTLFLKEDDVQALVKKYTLEGSIKPKCRLLQQAVYSYFNLLKTELANSLDTAAKNIVNQIGYPYLYNCNNLSSFKRLKNKQYKKLMQKQFRNLYEVSQKINEKQLTKEESRIYFEEVKRFENIVNSLEDVAKNYEGIIKKVLSSFSHDSSYIPKINEIIKSITSQAMIKPKQKEKESSPIKSQIKKASPEKESPKIKNPSQSKQNTQQMPKPQHINIPPPQLLKPNYARNVSIDKKVVKQNKFLGLTHSKSVKQKEPTLKEVKMLNNDKLEQVKQQLNHKQIEINQKKRMLIEMMKQKQESMKNAKQFSNNSIIEKKERAKSIVSTEIPSYFKRENSDCNVYKETVETEEKSHYADSNLKTQSEQNSHNELELFSNSSKKDQSQVQIKAFTQLPILEPDLFKQQTKQQIKEKIIIVSKPKEVEELADGKEAFKNSPILKKKKSIAARSPQKELKNGQQFVQLQQQFQRKQNQILELKENQEKSLALLLKSLTLSADEAIRYLQCSLDQAQNNLSAAQYLSFLYIQQNLPQKCLHLCNKMLEKLQHNQDSEQISLVISINKAAALNILGRYSQSILILERCLRWKEKDCIYKNLGDAYFSISIYEKAICNYETALKMNQNYDEAQYNMSVCLYVQQNYHNAKLAIQKALEIQPTNESYLDLLENIEMRIANYS